MGGAPPYGTGIRKGRHPMRIRLRPYHPTWVIGYFGLGGHPESYNSAGFNEIIGKISARPDLEVELVEEFDDICRLCKRLEEDPKGSVWGPRHSCASSRNPETVDAVKRANRQVLDALGSEAGSVIALKDLVALLKERLPVLDEAETGGPGFQKTYEEGIEAISRLWDK